MSAESAILELMKIHPKGFDLSLDRILGLLDKLGSPQKRIPPAFHIAGTNGKGSTSAFLRAILEAGGKSVHVHTSPHLVNWNERYRLGKKTGGKFVSDKKLEEAINRVAAANAGKAITVFEIMSAVGFVLFAENHADYTVMEVGLGGRFDATNVIEKPFMSLITPIALDHQAYLGDTLAKIAFEKAGIIKQKCPVVCAAQEDDAITVIEQVASKNNAVLTIGKQDFDYYEQHGRFIYQDEDGLLDLPLPRLAGDHQLGNAALAIAAVRKAKLNFDHQVFESAMQSVYWPGRLEKLPAGKLLAALPNYQSKNLEIWIDGGHNPHAGKVIAAALKKADPKKQIPIIMVAGMLTTKEPNGFFQAFKGLAHEVLTVPVNDSDSGFSATELSNIVVRNGIESKACTSIEEALADIGMRYGATAAKVIFCGSLYMVGEALRKNATPPK